MDDTSERAQSERIKLQQSLAEADNLVRQLCEDIEESVADRLEDRLSDAVKKTESALANFHELVDRLEERSDQSVADCRERLGHLEHGHERLKQGSWQLILAIGLATLALILAVVAINC